MRPLAAASAIARKPTIMASVSSAGQMAIQRSIAPARTATPAIAPKGPVKKTVWDCSAVFSTKGG